MATTDQIIDNPVTGERLRWHLTSADTGGRLARAEMWVRAGGGVEVEHFHPHSEERFEVIGGRMTLERGGQTHVLLGGDCERVPPGVPHRWRNAGDGELHLFIDIADPHGFEEMIEDAFAAARGGGVDSAGRMRLLPGAAFARRHGESIRVTSPPPWLQSVVVPPLALIARAVAALSSGRAAFARARSAT
jgi:mannose-6-phosphate isomerase-like protein (cupin superfamily)